MTFSLTGSPFHQRWQVSSLFWPTGSRNHLSLSCVIHTQPKGGSPGGQSVGGALGQLTASYVVDTHRQDRFMSTWATNLSSSKDIKANFRVHNLSELKWKKKWNQAWPSWGLSITPVFLGCVLAGKRLFDGYGPILFESASRAVPHRQTLQHLDSPSEPR